MQLYAIIYWIAIVCCLAHCRRKFYEAVPAARRQKRKLLDFQSDGAIQEPIIPEETELSTMIPGEVGLAYCNKRFFIERERKDLPADERKEKRLAKTTDGTRCCIRPQYGKSKM